MSLGKYVPLRSPFALSVRNLAALRLTFSVHARLSAYDDRERTSEKAGSPHIPRENEPDGLVPPCTLELISHLR